MAHATHIECLDGWRGLAILALLMGHFSPIPGINLGTLGVNLFFVLSGMLMGRLLFAERVPLTRFYRRRAARILPAHLCFIASVLLAYLLLGRTVDGAETLSAALFLNNYLLYNLGENQMPFGHVWSLAVEEHSYVLLGLIALVARRRRASVVVMLVLVLALSAGVSVAYWLLFDAKVLIFEKWLHTEVAGYGIFVSALCSVMFDRHPPQRVWRYATPMLLMLGAGLHWWAVPPPVRNVLGLAALALAVNLLPLANPILQRAFSVAWLRALGVWSFSLYLWQQPFYMAYRHGELPLALALAALMLTGLASFHLVEQPARRFLNAHWGGAIAARATGSPMRDA